MRSRFLPFFSCFLLIALLLVFIAALYLPGLSGGFEFDDVANVLENSHLFITDLSFEQLRSAALSGDAGPTGRPLALLSFALNIYFFGIEPYSFKLVNLLIHLANVVLVAFFSSILMRRVGRMEGKASWLAGLVVAALWGVHPLNLTSVLYVVQRMTSLSALFGFLAIALYLWGREVAWRSMSLSRFMLLALMICLNLVLSVLCKETGVLFFLLLLWIEFCFYGFDINGRPVLIAGVSLKSLMLVIGGVGVVVALIWIIPPMIGPNVFANRDFTLQERLLTESRVVFLYLGMIFYPTLSGLSLYHDDFLISTSLFAPFQTAICVAGVFVGLLGGVLLWNRCRALVFAFGWFAISQLLESTVFSLELVHEHRNYFASIGFFCFIVAWVFQLRSKARLALVSLLVGAFLLYSFVTYNRAVVWSNLVDHAAFEAAMHPDSPRANYQMGRIYLKLLSSTKDQFYAEKAERYFRISADGYKSSNGAYFALIHLASYMGKDPDADLLRKLGEGLKNGPFYNSNVSYLKSLVDCQLSRQCHLAAQDVVALLAASVENPHAAKESRSQVYLLLGRYFIAAFGDLSKGEEFFRDSISVQDQSGAHLMLVQVLRLQGRIQEAEQHLQQAEALDRAGVYVEWVRSERLKLKQTPEKKTSKQNAKS